MKREDISKLEGEEYKKAVKKLKRKTTVKKILSDVIGVVLFFGIIFGGYKLWSDYKSGNAYNDDSYKVETKRDNSYDGIYSLTKLDENGNNTWDGLMLYVKNDKVVSCDKYDYYTKKEWNALSADKRNNLLRSEGKYDQILTGFSIDESVKEYGYPLRVGSFVGVDKINIADSSDIRTVYDYMKSCDIVPGYDEKSQEVWLSKLLSNKKSIYHEGYKLMHYDGYEDINKNCRLNSGWCIDDLNEMFNAGLSNW
ncbi:MAG: hypothetical protein ACLSVX_02175 [Massilimicrobiota timonensis]